MKAKAVEKAKERLARAETDVANLRSPDTLDDLVRAWSEFLTHAGTIYTALEQGAKGAGSSHGWYGRKKQQRKNDALLQYIHHARNSDEHGIEDLTHWDAKTKLFPFDDENRTGIAIVSGPVVLVPVVDRGATYDVPTEHLGQPLTQDDKHPCRIAEIALDFLKSLVAEAETYVTQ